MDYGVKPAIDLRFKPHLRSNDLSRREVLEDAARFKVQALTDLQTLDKEIQALQRKRYAVKDGLWAFDCILAPIRRLSDDVLVEIFCHCIPTTRNARPFVSEAPLLLTLVCKKWRTIAMSAPRLWTTLHIPVVFNYSPRLWVPYRRFQYIPKADVPQSAFSELYSCRNVGLDQWLRRSGHLSLSLSLYWSTPGAPAENRDPTASLRRATLDLIARYADRISRLDVDISSHILHELSRAITEHFDFKSLPRLQQLRVSSDQGIVIPINPPLSTNRSILTAEIFEIFLGAKSLRELSSRGLGKGIDGVLVHVASTNITTLFVHEGITVSAACSALSQLHRLERCHLEISNASRTSWLSSVPAGSAPRISSEPIILPVLNTLSINSAFFDIQSFCERLEVPALSVLHLHIMPGSNRHLAVMNADTSSNPVTYDICPPDTVQHLCAFLARCTSMHSLTLSPSYIQADELQSILSVIPQVEHLVLNSPQAIRVCTQLVSHTGATQFLPVMKYSLDPLLRQQRVLSDASGNGEVHTRIDTPLLPSLQSFEWYQSSGKVIPDDHFVAFINNRLFQTPTQISAGWSVTASSVSRLEIPQQAPTKSLKRIKIRALSVSDVDSIESMIIQHAEREGLARGVDFQLDVGMCPSAPPAMSDGPRYVIPPGFSRPEPVLISEDNLIIRHDVTWPWVEF
ncbi:hypothetical protein BJ165DRAFT_256472 [Panaeolus papilionaceus]|nr:hypothetical protein BJ165DRAFT_256472 [Panaeolus papilionaceus]